MNKKLPYMLLLGLAVTVFGSMMIGKNLRADSATAIRPCFCASLSPFAPSHERWDGSCGWQSQNYIGCEKSHCIIYHKGRIYQGKCSSSANTFMPGYDHFPSEGTTTIPPYPF